MTIYLIFYYDEYVGKFFQEAFSTSEKALLALEHLRSKIDRYYDIEEYELDPELPHKGT